MLQQLQLEISLIGIPEHSVIKSKSYLRDKIKIRINDRVNYKENIFDDRLRLAKKDDEILDDMLFIKIDDEII